jgi:hypothetical protein
MYASLPANIRIRGKRAYTLFRQDPSHPGLNFKKVEGQENIYSVRIGTGYRALGKLDGEQIVWFWIGSHSEYDKLLR